MSEENKEGRTVRDLKPEKDVKGGIGTEPPEPGDGKKNPFNPDKPVPPITGAH